MDKKRLLILDDGDSIPENLPEDWNIIYDLGGFLDARIEEALMPSDYVLVPVIWDEADFQSSLDCISEMEDIDISNWSVGSS